MTALPKYLALLPMFAAVAGAGAQASAEEFRSNGRTMEVHYQDLDLARKADRRELDARIRRAAIKVCPDRTLEASRACQLSAIDHVRAPIYAAVAKANGKSGEVFADKGADKPVGMSH